MIALGLILLILGFVFGLGGQTLLYVGGGLVILGLLLNLTNHRVW